MKPAEFDMDTGLKIGVEGVRIMKIYRENPLRPLTPPERSWERQCRGWVHLPGRWAAESSRGESPLQRP